MDIRCYRLQLSQDNATDYLTCTCIYPPIEIATLTRGSNRSTDTRSENWADWESGLKTITNAAVRDFFAAELPGNQENRLRYRQLIYRVGDKRRYWVAARREFAYVEQGGRFDNDEAYWRARISNQKSVGQRRHGRAVRFKLSTAGDFAAFKTSLHGEMKTVLFSAAPEDDVSTTED